MRRVKYGGRAGGGKMGKRRQVKVGGEKGEKGGSTKRGGKKKKSSHPRN